MPVKIIYVFIMLALGGSLGFVAGVIFAFNYMEKKRGEIDYVA